MASNKATVKVDCANIDEYMEKIEKLLNLLQQVKQLQEEIQHPRPKTLTAKPPFMISPGNESGKCHTFTLSLSKSDADNLIEKYNQALKTLLGAANNHTDIIQN